jgi:hypothetical protein
MWTPEARTLIEEAETPAGHFIVSSHIAKQAQRLMPNDGTYVVSDIRDFYDLSERLKNDPNSWGFFKQGGYNFAVCRPLNFILGQTVDVTVGALRDDEIEPRPDHARDSELPAKISNHDNNEAILIQSVQATMLEPARARKIGGKVLIPAILSSYTEMDGVSGYSGYKTWVITPDRIDSENLFMIPDITPNTVGASNKEEHELAAEAPDLGPLCARQINAVADRLISVQASDKTESPVFA